MPVEVQVRIGAGPEPSLERDSEGLQRVAARAAGWEQDRVAELRLERVSFDARPRERNWLVRMTLFERGEAPPQAPASTPPRLASPRGDAPRVAIVGAGPAGLFCALELAAGGLRVVLVDRGGDVRARRRPLARLNRGQGVDRDSNYCFGEGGAGTYSDGKLLTRAGRKRDVRAVLETLVAHGAAPSILSSWRPHIGSNKLPELVQTMRRTLLEAGVEVRFHCRAEEILTDSTGRRVVGLQLRELAPKAGEPETLRADAVVLAPGHSARDALEMAARAGVRLEPKGFALGVRVEHPQGWLDELQYGGLRTECELPAAFYELASQVDGRGVYSFCMCPGGWIVPATTAPDRVVVNGMSLSRRDSPFANSGLVVQLEPGDWCGAEGRAGGWSELCGGAPAKPEEDPLFGVRIQEALERRCASAAGGQLRAPGETVRAFLGRDTRGSLPRTSYRPGAAAVDLGSILPAALTSRLRDGLGVFEDRLPGFASSDGLLVAPESRTSSPVRLVRDRASLEAEHVAGGTLSGLLPAGEGAGYAGGIVSAAIDGRRCAQQLLARLA